MDKNNFKGNTKLFNNLLVGTADEKGTIWIVSEQSDTHEKVVIDLDEDNARNIAKWLLQVTEG